jgi:predicted nucleotidyltransferase
MEKEAVLAKLRNHRRELEAAGAEHVSIFGSVARGDAHDSSDLDVLVTFSDPVILSGFGYFSAVEDLRGLIATITGAQSVDILAEPVRKERLRQSVERDRAIAY